MKSLPSRLFVHIERGPTILPVGELEFDDGAPGGFAARFRYLPDWLENPLGFALDPLNMPLSSGGQWIATDNKYIKLGVLFDAGPDMWGRRVLRAQTDQPQDEPTEHQVLLMGRGNGVGALLFSRSAQLTRDELPGLASLPSIETDLLRTHQAAHSVFDHSTLEPREADLLAGSWSIGGARAKAVMKDAFGKVWIAKFSEPGDSVDRQRIEYANLRMAAAIGLAVPQVRVADTELGSVLLVERFDRAAEDGTRLHYASAISLVSAVPEDKRMTSARDKAIFSYARLSDVIGRISPAPAKERQELFARMVLNVCVRNTDDHLKNIGFMEAEGSPRHMRLARVFDVVTQLPPAHFLTIGEQGRVGSIENALSEPRKFGLTNAGARAISDLVVEVVASRRDFYDECGLCEADVEWLEARIEDRCPRAPSRRTPDQGMGLS